MSNFAVQNVKTSVGAVLETKKAVAEFIAAAGVTDNSAKTIEKKIAAAILNEEVLYETFKIEETEEESIVTTETAIAASKAAEEVIAEETATEETATEETVSEETPATETEETPAEKTSEESELDDLESPEAAEEVEKENKEFEDVIKGDKKEESKPNKRRQGKTLLAFKNGEEYESFPSIKACAKHFQELLELKHLPFTPIMKSVRQGVDWNEYSFKFENEADLHIPSSSKKEEMKPDAKEKEEMKDQAEKSDSQDEVIEEVVEEIVEEVK